MSVEPQERRRSSGRRSMPVPACPACGGPLPPATDRCPSCGFTGEDTMEMFSDSPPPLLPVFDAAGIWKDVEIRMIEAARQKIHRRFPQFQWHVYSVVLPSGGSLPLFGFWLLNTCPYYVNETAQDRSWAVLLLIDARTGKSTVVPGYSAGRWLGDDDWKKALSSMAGCWRGGRPAEAVIHFFHSCSSILDQSWKTHGIRRKGKAKS